MPSKAFLLATNTVCFVTFLALAQSSVLPSFFHNLLFSVISSLMELSHHMSSHSICPFLTNHKLSVAERTLFKIFPYVINIIRIIYPVIARRSCRFDIVFFHTRVFQFPCSEFGYKLIFSVFANL